MEKLCEKCLGPRFFSEKYSNKKNMNKLIKLKEILKLLLVRVYQSVTTIVIKEKSDWAFFKTGWHYRS